jgi:hypothetical protein
VRICALSDLQSKNCRNGLDPSIQRVAAEHWPSHSVLPVVRHEERKAPRNATQVLLVPDRLSREEELAHENIVHLLAVLNARRPVTSVIKNSWSSGLTCPASPSAIRLICRSSSWTRWSIFGWFSQSCSDVIGLGCCGGEGDGAMALGFQRRPSS